METGHPVNRVTWTQKLLQELDTLYGAYLSSGFGPVREEWLERSHMQGQRVSVTNHGQVTTGLVAGIEDNGALLLRLDTGSIEKIYSGDVKLVG
jgi:BirA family biotin operon repressor/biotin-[acetyl-CoA-carboxylase] ligase